MTDGSTTITLNEPERRALEGLVANRNMPAKVVWHAKIILATARGLGTMAICKETRSLKRHRDDILAWFDSRIANGLIEGINSLGPATCTST